MYPSDSMQMKVMVGVICLSHTPRFGKAKQLLIYSHYYLILNYANPLGLLHVVWSVTGMLGVGTISTLLTNAYYIRRIHYPSVSNPNQVGNSNYFLTLGTACLWLVQCGNVSTTCHLSVLMNRGFSMAFRLFDMYVLYNVAIERAADLPMPEAVAIISSRITSLLGFATYSWLLMGGLATDAVTDAVLAATLTYLLKQRQQRNGYNSSLVEKLMMYAIALKPNDFIDMGIFLVFKKLWLNLRKPAPEHARVYQLKDLSSGSSGSSHNPQSIIMDPKKPVV
ncbi:hypothetical protein BDQ12DRAFT_671759 [Crucibulum laeve]|uniref:Uncharacterized protein n=1 Tax=Crucibulum laeve TaxID=68775 RepID=A0A5C3LFD0_9AGAR|nr:hypothetical protein BDQ12DRAFT_671759 [Crucibulum laeve]